MRIHSADEKLKSYFYLKYKNINKKIEIDNGKEKIDQYLNQNTLIVFSYFSTGMFELLSRNNICLCFDDFGKQHYQSKFYKGLKILKKNNIVFDDGITASNYINNLFQKKKKFIFKVDY